MLLEHPMEQRDAVDGELVLHDHVFVGDRVVVLGQLVGPCGPWDYFVTSYDHDGTRRTRRSTVHTAPSWARARDIFEEYTDSLRGAA